ncbi:MAG: hypothetical protein ABW352_20310 [Polyangiales bacterium]
MRDGIRSLLFMLLVLVATGCRVGVIGHAARDRWTCPGGQVAVYFDRTPHPVCMPERIAALTTCNQALREPRSMLFAELDAAVYMHAIEGCMAFAANVALSMDAGLPHP